ncbi:MAG TPA: sulfatase [Thermomicrobiales bacterium]|nr:sulfatase [Thermomicrobiales bacterium]
MAETTRRPNILYLHSHDTGRYVQPYGHAIPTPSLQRLAEEGVLFRQAFSAAPTCSPSRAALLTGQSPHSSGMLGLAHRGFRLNNYQQHLVHTLRRAGYASTLVGMQHVAEDPSWIGYDRILATADRNAASVAPAAAAFLASAPAEPFFLDVGFFETHRDFPEPGADEDARYVRPPAPLPDTPETRADMAAYQASARLLDAGIGAVLDALDAAGLAENTLVICTTDHGLAFPGMKCSLTDHGIGVMLLMRGPAGFSGGRLIEAMVSQIDLFPTLTEILAVDPPPWLQGTSMMPLIREEREQINDAIFAEVTYHAAYEPQRAIRTERWKYIRRFGERELPVLPNVDDSPSKDVWLRHGGRQRPIAREQLYDLVFDPHEAHNLMAHAEMAETLTGLRRRLDQWMHETNDPLLHGPIPPPAGVDLLHDPDGLSPRDPLTPVRDLGG